MLVKKIEVETQKPPTWVTYDEAIKSDSGTIFKNDTAGETRYVVVNTVNLKKMLLLFMNNKGSSVLLPAENYDRLMRFKRLDENYEISFKCSELNN